MTKLRSLVQLRVDAHFLPIEQGRIGMPMAGIPIIRILETLCKLPRYWRRCTLRATNIDAVGDEGHHGMIVSLNGQSIGHPHFQGLWQQHTKSFQPES